jgi:hypothetical protein
VIMSVENSDVDESPKQTMEYQPRDEEQEPLLTETKSESEVTEETGSGEDGLSSSILPETEEDEEEDGDNLNVLKLEAEVAVEAECCVVESDAKVWFDGLSAIERACAVGFVDGPFLAMVLAMASWSPPALEGTAHEGEVFFSPTYNSTRSYVTPT